MTKSEIIEFLNENPICYLATLENGNPRVRGMGMYKADETGIYFQSWTMKDIHKQIENNPAAEACFNAKGTQIRVSGEFEIVDDLEIKKDVEKKRPFMTATIEEKGYEVVAIYRLKNCRAHVWTMDANFDEKNYVNW